MMYYKEESTNVNEPKLELNYKPIGSSHNDLAWIDFSCIDGKSKIVVVKGFEHYTSDVKQIGSLINSLLHRLKSDEMIELIRQHSKDRSLKELQPAITSLSEKCNTMNKQLIQCSKQCNDLNKLIDEKLNPNVKNYRTWGVMAIINYINSLNNGKYGKLC